VEVELDAETGKDVPLGAPEGAPEGAVPLGGLPPPLPPPTPLEELATPPSAYSVAAAERVCWLVKSIPNAIQAKIPSSTLLPSKEYSTTGSEEAASSLKIESTSFSALVCW